MTTFGSTPKKPRINLPKKSNNTHSKILSFINQIRLIIQFHQHCYPDDKTQVELIGTLLSSTTLTWFAPLLEHQSPLSNNFETFCEEYGVSFSDSNKKCIATSKLRTLCQGSRPTFMYVSTFRQLACDIWWNKIVLMN